MDEPIVEPIVTEPKVEPIIDTKVEPVVKTEPPVEPKKEIMIPKERFDEVNGKYKELAGQMEEMKTAKEDMQKLLADMKTAQEGTQTSIADTTAKLEAQVKSYETLMNEMVSTKLQAVPEDMQELIPEGLSTEQKLAWINKAEAKGLFKPKDKVVIGQPLNHSSEQDKVERMKKMNPLQLLASYYGDSK
jgi:hypothetical protein